MINYKEQVYVPASIVNFIKDREPVYVGYIRNDLHSEGGEVVNDFWSFIYGIESSFKIHTTFYSSALKYLSGRSNYKYKFQKGKLSVLGNEKILAYFTYTASQFNTLMDIYGYYKLLANNTKRVFGNLVFNNWEEFANYIEVKIDKVTVFVDKSFYASKTPHKGLRKEFLAQFKNNKEFDLIVVENLESKIYDTVLNTKLKKEGNFLELIERNEDILYKARTVLKDKLIPEHHNKTNLKTFQDELLQERSLKFFPYKRILQGITLCKSSVGENVSA